MVLTYEGSIVWTTIAGLVLGRLVLQAIEQEGTVVTITTCLATRLKIGYTSTILDLLFGGCTYEDSATRGTLAHQVVFWRALPWSLP
jgi:hypothetical protein